MVGGIRPSAGVVLPLLPPALLHYTINRRKLQAVRQKICAKKVEMLGGVPCAAPVRPAVHVPGGGAGGWLLPLRHLVSLPRGRGPSQTPKFLSPGPPSPWLPALPMERRFFRCCAGLEIPKAHPAGCRIGRASQCRRGQAPPPNTTAAGIASVARVQLRGCKGRSPLHKITLKLPLPRRGRGLGG